MNKLTKYEINELKRIKNELNLFERILLRVLKKYSYKIYKEGYRNKYFEKNKYVNKN